MKRSQRRKCRLLQRTEGASAVEFALVLPALLLILLGIIDFGNLYYQLHNVNEASRAGVRYASIDPNLASIATDVSTYVKANYGNTLTVTTAPSPLTSKGTVTVTVSNTVKALIIGVFFTSNPFTLTGKCTMQLEN